MRDLFVAAVVFGVLPWVLRQPKFGIYLWCWISYMNPHRLCYGFALSFPFAYTIALATMGGLLISKEPKRIPWTRESILLLVFILWMGVTTLNAFYGELAMEQYTKVIKIQLMIFVTLMVINNREKLHGMVWIIALSLGYYGIKGGIFTIAKGGVHRVQGPDGTFIGGNNELALALIMTIPLIRYLHLQEKRQWLKTGLAGAMVLTALSAIGSQSRGALIGLSLMGTMFWLKSRNKFMTAFLIVITVGMVAAIMPQAWYDRMHTVKSYEQDASAMGRINAWWTSFNVAKDRLTGGGFEMLRPEVYRHYAPDPGDIHDVHSIYFEILGEQGFIGLAMFLTLGLFTWFTLSRVAKASKHDPEQKWMYDLATMVQVSIIGYASAGAFLGLAYFDYIYSLVAIAVILESLRRQQAALNKPAIASFRKAKHRLMAETRLSSGGNP